MRLFEMMSRPVVTIGPGESASAAWERIKMECVRHLVVTEGRKVVGLVSALDLGGPEGAAFRDSRTVADVMTRPVVTARPNTTIREAANLLRGCAIDCLPVVEGDRLVGIVTTTDLLELVGRGAERPVPRSTRWTLKDRGPRKSGRARQPVG